MNTSLPETKPQLMTALRARLERCQYEVAAAAVAFLMAITSGEPKSAQEEKRKIALGECWRRNQLVALGCTAMHMAPEHDLQELAVFFLGLAECDPITVPSCQEWMERLGEGDPNESNVQEVAVGGD